MLKIVAPRLRGVNIYNPATDFQEFVTDTQDEVSSPTAGDDGTDYSQPWDESQMMRDFAAGDDDTSSFDIATQPAYEDASHGTKAEESEEDVYSFSLCCSMADLNLIGQAQNTWSSQACCRFGWSPTIIQESSCLYECTGHCH
jgi:hypothetical protein